MEDGFNKFYSKIYSALKIIQKLKTKYMEHFGLSSTHTMCLRHLNSEPEGITRTKLAKLCNIDKAQISRIINELCSKGYVTEPDGENINYRKRLKLTSLGKNIADDIESAIIRVQSFVSGDIPEDQLDLFYSTLDMICNKLKQAEDSLEQPV